ncbi:hypothetical protein Btru_041543 [Bulinus truncatus]|nr:hypothetical protein Btru_041543 [Bulinus truncatus]
MATIKRLPGPPEHFHLNSHNSTTATLSWQPPKNNVGAILRYHVVYFEDGNTTFKEFVVKASKQEKVEFIMTHLKPNTYYKVKIKAENSAGNGTLTTNPVVFTTEEGLDFNGNYLLNLMEKL